MVTSRDHETRAAVAETFRDPLRVIGDGGEAVRLRFDEEIGKRLAAGGMHRDINGAVECGRVALEPEKFDPRGDVARPGPRLAVGAGGTVAREPKLPIDFRWQPRGDLDQLTLVFFRPQHGDAEQDGRGGSRAVLGPKFRASG